MLGGGGGSGRDSTGRMRVVTESRLRTGSKEGSDPETFQSLTGSVAEGLEELLMQQVGVVFS